MNVQRQHLSVTKKPTVGLMPFGALQRKCTCGGHTLAGGECEECKKNKSVFQRKLAIGESNDPLEQEADRIAEEVMAGPLNSPVKGAPPRIQRFTGQVSETLNTAPPSVDHALASPGRPLEPPLRQEMESRFAHDFSGVRVHTGVAAERSAREVNALAYTVGRDIVFGQGQFSPNTKTGQRLLAHELAHTIQQHDAVPAKFSELEVSDSDEPAEREAAYASDAAMVHEHAKPAAGYKTKIAREIPATAQTVGGAGGQIQQTQTQTQSLTPPFGPSFAQLWSEFEQHQVNFREKEALAIAPALALMMSGRDAIDHGLELAQWAGQRGDWDTARRALGALETAWWVQFVSIGGGVALNNGSLGNHPQVTLITWAKSEAAAGRHDHARQLFGLPFLMIQMVLQEQSARHLASLASMGQVTMDFAFIRLLHYSDERTLMGLLREILSFYPNLERQALAAGQTAEASRLAGLGQQLRTDLHDHYTLLGGGEGSAALTLEASSAESRGVQGFKLHGVRGAEEVVTPLPGTPLPDELGKHPAYTASMEDVIGTLAGQEDFFTGLMQHQEFRKVFGTTRPDVYNLNARLRVWEVIFRVFQKQPMNGCPTALCSLLRLMQQYLRHFTTHTEYNIRDFGQTYLTSQFPEDLIGRTMRDCGVYAVTVAYEVFRTARGASPRISVGFQLYHTLEHSMLAIFDTDNHSHYVVNNDQITGPNPGDTNDAVAGSIAGAYAGTMGANMAASIGGRSEMLTTQMSDASFSARIWQNYQVGATLALRTEPPSGPDDSRSEAERREGTYRRYYQRMARLSETGVKVHGQLDELNRVLASRPRAEHAAIIQQTLASLSDAGIMMALFFDTYLLNPRASGLAMARTTVSVEGVGLFTAGTGQVHHPLVRIGRLLLYYQGLGQTLTQQQQNLVNGLINQRVIPSFSSDLSGYQSSGRPANF